MSTSLLVCINATSGTHRRLQSEPCKSKIYIQAVLASPLLTTRHGQIKRAFGEKLRTGYILEMFADIDLTAFCPET